MHTDQIHVRGLTVLAPHGVYDEERKEGRSFTVDLDAYVPITDAGTQDALAQTVNYCDLTDAILYVLQGQSRYLIETLAVDIVDEIFKRAAAVTGVRVTVWKRALDVPGDPERVGVTIERQRAERS